jgi:isopenicillin N synthase-like dioxygenase
MAATMTYVLDAKHVSKASLPVIEVAGLSSSSPANRRHVAESLRRACLDKGFFTFRTTAFPPV